ncbi:MAG: hypothetical protein SGI77_18575 [Pirellulaceae bacterium]|nr:hypothetical protein [Pirellulaceae bacterium]
MRLFAPNYTISNTTASALVRIESVRQQIEFLPIHPALLAALRESARLFSTHYSTLIEGNRLTQEQVDKVLANAHHFPGRERDETEIKGYYAALSKLETMVARKSTVTELCIRTLHALLMGGGKKRVKPTDFRDSQNVIRDSSTGRIVYMPPVADDVPKLMKQLVAWIKRSALPQKLWVKIDHLSLRIENRSFNGHPFRIGFLRHHSDVQS